MGPVRHTHRGEGPAAGGGFSPYGRSGWVVQRSGRWWNAGPRRAGPRVPGAAGLMGAVGVVLTVAAVLSGCGGPRSASGRASSSGGRSIPTAVAAARDAAVVQAWTAAVQTVYRYDREPWPAIRRSLIAGTPPLQLFPDLGRYFTGAALSAAEQSVVGIKLQELTGAKVDRIGSPTVVSMHGSTATVAGCIYDSGSLTGNGKPGPESLDGGAGYGRGTWVLQRIGSDWRISLGQAKSVASC